MRPIFSMVFPRQVIQGNDAADCAAVEGAEQHCCSQELAACFSQHSQHALAIALMYTEIALARNNWAKKEHLLTYARQKQSKSSPPHTGVSSYFFDIDAGQPCLPKLMKFPEHKKYFRFPFGTLAWEGLAWYLSRLKWPKKDDNSLGVTWIELALDFELATGLTLPRGASICENHFGSRRLGRHASWTGSSHTPHQETRLEHCLGKVIQDKKTRFRCMVCGRTGAWPDRSKFLKQSCAGYKETPLQAMKRLKHERDLKRCISDSPIAPATLFEKYRVFTDMIDSMTRQVQCFYGDKILTCRALAPLGLPKSSGLDRRPILLCQTHVTNELQQCAQALPHKFLQLDDDPNVKAPSWSSHQTPYSIDLPRSIWRPPPAPD